MNGVADNPTAWLEDAVAFSQHGELVQDSAEHVRVNDRVKAAGPKRQHAAISRDHVGFFFEITFGSKQGVEGNVARHEAASAGLCKIGSRPPMSCPDVQQAGSRRQREVVTEGPGLLNRRVTVEADLMTENRTLHLSGCLRPGASILLKEEIEIGLLV